ncbi:ABC transporter substrate-binding protein [Antarcticimicrobium sediminis]|uniref:ABC transporter substrate-binding protein n=1 Tax=Antarcticimicrobium sediminis TaxID=2546227 RepID=A0A4R5EMV3_9RHOB|nr:ABC transporter substrate-binding protein [Antarcticimicrobium sediminis]TDE35914.1 ABC transporter substrate-binding protein [Antarcticimicrobium sediminis]
MTALKLFATASLIALSAAVAAQAQELRIGLQSDADVLDPDQSRTFVGEIVFTSLCDKLVDITPDLELVPQLATQWSWSEAGDALTLKLREGVTFHDGTQFNAEAVAYNIERSQTLEESRRKSDLASVAGTDVLGPYEIRINLTRPDAGILSEMANRPGMMISPTAAKAEGANFGLAPVCSGPFQFADRVAQDRITLKAYPEYWNASEIHLDSVVFLPIPDTTVRLANLQSGDIQLLERLAATDLTQVEGDDSLTIKKATSLGYQGITFNIDNGARGDNPWGNDKRLRQAFSYAIDRDVLNQVVFEGAFTPANQPPAPSSPWFVSEYPAPARDVEKAKSLLAEAGYPDGLTLEVQVPNTNEPMQLMQVIQAMASEAGIDVQITAKEFATMLQDQTAGDFIASQVGWSGYVDPSANLHQFVTTGGGINDAHYSNPEVDRLLNAARSTTDTTERKSLYAQARAILVDEAPLLYLYHPTWLWTMRRELSGFVPYPDGRIRLEGVRLDG